MSSKSNADVTTVLDGESSKSDGNGEVLRKLYTRFSRPVGLAILEYSVDRNHDDMSKWADGSLEFKKLYQNWVTRGTYGTAGAITHQTYVCTMMRLNRMKNIRIMPLKRLTRLSYNFRYEYLSCAMSDGTIAMIKYIMKRLHSDHSDHMSEWYTDELIRCIRNRERDDKPAVMKLWFDWFGRNGLSGCAKSDLLLKLLDCHELLVPAVEYLGKEHLSWRMHLSSAIVLRYIDTALYIMDNITIDSDLSLTIHAAIRNGHGYDRNNVKMRALMTKLIQKYMAMNPYGDEYEVTIVDKLVPK